MKAVTPEEDQRQTRKEKWIWIVTSIVVVVIAFLVAFGVGQFLHPQDAEPMPDSGKRLLVRIFQIVVFLSISGVGGWWIGRTRRKILEKKLGRGVYGDHELTSLTSWIEASRKDEEHARGRKMQG
jgi:hypothetical protein